MTALSLVPVVSRFLPLPLPLPLPLLLCVFVVVWQLDSMRSKLHEVGGDDVEVGTKIDKAEVRVCGALNATRNNTVQYSLWSPLSVCSCLLL